MTVDRVERAGRSLEPAASQRTRRRAGAEALIDDGAVTAYRQRFRTLADLDPGAGEERMGTILIDAHLAANAIRAIPRGPAG